MHNFQSKIIAFDPWYMLIVSFKKKLIVWLMCIYLGL